MYSGLETSTEGQIGMVPDSGAYIPKPHESEDKPYGGLLGDSVTLRVVEEMVADPDTVYAPTDLAELTDSSPPAVRKVLNELARLRLVRLANKNRKRPVYILDKSNKRFFALELLAYARLDDREGTTFFEDRLREIDRRLTLSVFKNLPQNKLVVSTAPAGNQESDTLS